MPTRWQWAKNVKVKAKSFNNEVMKNLFQAIWKMKSMSRIKMFAWKAYVMKYYPQLQTGTKVMKKEMV